MRVPPPIPRSNGSPPTLPAGRLCRSTLPQRTRRARCALRPFRAILYPGPWRRPWPSVAGRNTCPAATCACRPLLLAAVARERCADRYCNPEACSTEHPLWKGRCGGTRRALSLNRFVWTFAGGRRHSGEAGGQRGDAIGLPAVRQLNRSAVSPPTSLPRAGPVGPVAPRTRSDGVLMPIMC